MAPTKPISRAVAEQKALDGTNESQETQQILHKFQMKYGVGIRSSSPAGDDQIETQDVRAVFAKPLAPASSKVNQGWVGETKPTTSKSSSIGAPADGNKHPRRGARASHNRNRQAASAAQAASLDATTRVSSAKTKPRSKKAATVSDPVIGSGSGSGSGGHKSHERLTKSSESLADKATTSSPLELDDGARPFTEAQAQPQPPPSPVEGPNPLVRVDCLPKMQPSPSQMEALPQVESQSPTQSNDGRDYEQYRRLDNDLIPTDPPQPEEVGPSSQRSAPSSPPLGHETPLDLKFSNTGSQSFFNSPALELDDDGFARPLLGSPRRRAADPETPAPPRNPFARSHVPLLESSQLFKQTQYSSTTKAAVSPTSSRPSPEGFSHNSISPNPVISSPLKTRGLKSSPQPAVMSSPQDLPGVESQPPAHEEETRDNGDVADDLSVPESPQPVPSKKKMPRAELMNVYEPMHESQARRESSEAISNSGDDVDAFSDDEMERRAYRAKSRRGAATKGLMSIPVPRPLVPEDVEVPSTNTRKAGKTPTAEERYIAQCHGVMETEFQETVEDSQDRGSQPVRDDHDRMETDDSPSVVANTLPNTASSITGNTKGTTTVEVSSGSRLGDAIPETSPPDAQPRPFHEMMPQSSGGRSTRIDSFSAFLDNGLHIGSSAKSDGRVSSSLPRLSSIPSTQGAKSAGRRLRERESMDGNGAKNNTIPNTSSPKSPNVPQPQATGAGTIESLAIMSPPPAFSTRSKKRGPRSVNEPHLHVPVPSTAPVAPMGSASTLSPLSATPAMSDKTTPLTDESALTAKVTSLRKGGVQSSPAVAKARRRESTDAIPQAKPGPVNKLRTSTRQKRRSSTQNSDSTDEPAGSPSASIIPTFEQSIIKNPRVGRASLKELPASRDQSLGKPKVFAGMVFAISFQGKQPGEEDDHYDSRIELSSKLERKIKQGGGRVLSEGFDELFEIPAVKNANATISSSASGEDIKLAAAANLTGFTALIADGHSRKVKYMQALALGLPCIHERWVTVCIEKQKVVDWSDYLLCAGNSTVLGDAVRSRNLAPYDAASAEFAQVVEHRPRLLEGSKILVVMKKGIESQKKAYLFLARVLGASLCRVYSIDEARKQLKAMEDLGQPFDWVYVVDKKMPGRAELFANPGASSASSKKRKRASTAADGPPPKKIRTLSDELVIQSLILGRLIEEGEMGV